MLSLFGSLLGFGTSFLPSILGFFEKGQSNKHDLRMLEAKAKYADTLSKLKVQELDAKADVEESRSIYLHASEVAKNNKSSFILNSWDQETAILFSTVISFWFGGRAMRKIRESKNG